MSTRKSASSTLSGAALLQDPLRNRGTAFSDDERKALHLHGLLPPHGETLAQQARRAYEAYRRKDDDLERHIYLRALQDTNEVLYYRLLLDHVEEMLPMVYTPVVAQACQRFSHIYRRPRGLFIPYPLRNDIPALLRNRPNRDIDVIVVTDGERILGIGDQGAGGLGIPIGKLSLYTLIGGIRPERTLPIVLDVGTNNEERLKDPEYIGWRHKRVTGKAYYDFVDQFVSAVKKEMPRTCLQWEDFATPHARPLLERYRDRLLTFNDDVQGTAAVVLGAVMGGVKVSGGGMKDQRIVFLGAGSAGVGVADYLRYAMVADGLTEAQARARFWFVDKDGLLHDGRTDLTPEQRVYAQPAASVPGKGGLAEVVDQAHPTVLIGLSTVGGAFTEAIVRSMAATAKRPIILPLSNPTDHSEAQAEDLIKWTDGRALVAAGSPFAPVAYKGRSIRIPQCNNVFIFPAVGLGLVASGATRVSDAMLLAAARALGALSPALRDPNGGLLPEIKDIRRVARAVALAVARQAVEEGLAPKATAAELKARVAAKQWTPAYD